MGKLTSQEVDDKTVNKTNKSTYRQAKKSTSQPASKSTIRASRRKRTSPSNPSKQDNQQVNKSGSQKGENIESQEVADKIDSKSTSQQVNKSVVRKSTFQLSSTILEQLDRLHLELQLELGKQDAPYKEVIVEEAIAQLLEVAAENRSDLVEALLERQSQRK